MADPEALSGPGAPVGRERVTWDGARGGPSCREVGRGSRRPSRSVVATSWATHTGRPRGEEMERTRREACMKH
ncbi:hypothetical protein ACFPM0_21335 [Pseudonocardia sulfidoxydans]|uniref:hypothetical protein n=1 Tax=Pseudonocardia sulfidoxydans TaxID=54011 RepID=UPI0036101122